MKSIAKIIHLGSLFTLTRRGDNNPQYLSWRAGLTGLEPAASSVLNFLINQLKRWTILSS